MVYDSTRQAQRVASDRDCLGAFPSETVDSPTGGPAGSLRDTGPERLGRLRQSVEWTDNRGRVLQVGAAIGAGGLIVAIALGVAANVRVSGLGVAPALASGPLLLRSSLALYGCVAILLSLFWARMYTDAPAIAGLRGHLTVALSLCATGPLLVLATNYTTVAGLTSDHVALLPAAVMFAVTIVYALVVHRLSGITGVGLGARLVLRSSYVWLLIAAGLQFAWVAARVFGDRPDLLWYVERPMVEIAMIGFGITGALGVLLTNLSSVYHSRDMTQTLMRSYQAVNALIALWGLSLMWAMRFPGSYQGLAAVVVGIALLILLTVIAGSSGLLERRNLPLLGDRQSPDGAWATGLASVIMLMVVITGVLIASSATVLAGMGRQPPHGLLGAQVATVALGIVPLSLAVAVAAIGRGLRGLTALGSLLIAAGASAGLTLWAVSGLVERSIAGMTAGAEALVGIGLALIVLTIKRINVPER